MINAFVGPYAEWLVPLGVASPWVNDTPILEDLGGISYVACQGELPTVDLDGVEHVRFTFWPEEVRDGGPARDLYHGSYGWHAATVDVSAADRLAEVRWFAGAYKGELDRLTGHFGAAPRKHWGVLAWLQ
jgi:hypothetical protein